MEQSNADASNNGFFDEEVITIGPIELVDGASAAAEHPGAVEVVESLVPAKAAPQAAEAAPPMSAARKVIVVLCAAGALVALLYFLSRWGVLPFAIV
jgi:hypothetical protein